MKETSRRLTRRKLLKCATAAMAAPLVVRASALGAAGRPAASDRLTLGMIGLGSMGMRHVLGFLEEDDCRIVAVCDVDAARRAEAVGTINAHYGNDDCARYADFREMIARDEIDTLCIAVPDHWHAIIGIRGARAGKDIYGEKLLALTVAEGQQMVRTVRQCGTVWQMGSWQRSTMHFRMACELVRNGRVGALRRVEVGIGPGHEIEPQPATAVPEGFDYEMWLGPAPWAPYTANRCHWNFRWISDYSGGQVTDWGAHHIDIAHWGMGADETGPVSVVGSGQYPKTGLYDTAVTYSFECEYASGVTMQVANTTAAPYVRFIGDRGSVRVNRATVRAEPESILRETIRADEIHLARPDGDNRQGHRHDFLQCVRNRRQPITPIEIGHRSIAVAHIANIAMAMGRKLRWDPAAERFVGDEQANRMLFRPMREPWRL